MADDNKLVAEPREQFGKGFARRIRAAGKIPAVIYGHGTDPQHVTLPGHEVGLILRKANQVLELDISGKTQLALVKDVQKDPVHQIIEHLDLVVVRKGEKVTVDIPVHVEGESVAGTIAALDANTLSVEAEATHIPERLTVNIEGAEEGTQIFAKDIELPEGSTLISDPDTLVVNVFVPAVVDLGEAAAAEAAEAAEGEEGCRGRGCRGRGGCRGRRRQVRRGRGVALRRLIVAAEDVWLVAGLGNPGPGYAGHRHNVGQMALAELADRVGAARRATFKNHKANASVAEARIAPGGAKLVLAKPNTFMNLSGGPVAALLRFYKLDPSRLIVLHDELDIPFDTIRVKSRRRARRPQRHPGHRGRDRHARFRARAHRHRPPARTTGRGRLRADPVLEGRARGAALGALGCGGRHRAARHRGAARRAAALARAARVARPVE